jgi:hypothetical protein
MSDALEGRIAPFGTSHSCAFHPACSAGDRPGRPTNAPIQERHSGQSGLIRSSPIRHTEWTLTARRRQERSVSSISVDVTTKDLELIEQACRALADRYRRDADAHIRYSLRDVARRSQEKFLRLAERVEAARKGSPSNVRPLERRT